MFRTERDVILWTGVAVTILGTAIASPGGVRWLWREGWRPVRRAVRQAHGWLARRLPFLRRGANVHGVAALAKISAGGSATARIVLGWNKDDPLEAKVERLRHQVSQVLAEVYKAQDAEMERHAALEKNLGEAVAELRGADKELHGRLDKAEIQAARIDARGVILLGFGVILTAIPDDLARVAAIGWIVLAVAVIVTARVAWLAWRDAKAA